MSCCSFLTGDLVCFSMFHEFGTLGFEDNCRFPVGIGKILKQNKCQRLQDLE